jgi:hypothetical protein
MQVSHQRAKQENSRRSSQVPQVPEQVLQAQAEEVNGRRFKKPFSFVRYMKIAIVEVLTPHEVRQTLTSAPIIKRLSKLCELVEEQKDIFVFAVYKKVNQDRCAYSAFFSRRYDIKNAEEGKRYSALERLARIMTTGFDFPSVEAADAEGTYRFAHSDICLTPRSSVPKQHYLIADVEGSKKRYKQKCTLPLVEDHGFYTHSIELRLTPTSTTEGELHISTYDTQSALDEVAWNASTIKDWGLKAEHPMSKFKSHVFQIKYSRNYQLEFKHNRINGIEQVREPFYAYRILDAE